MSYQKKDVLHKFVVPMINKYLGNIIRYNDRAYEVTGFIGHKDLSRTVVLECQEGEEFISYQEFLQILYPANVKSYQRIPRPNS